MNNPTTETPYRWLILILAALTFTFGMAMPTMAMPVLFKEISEELGLSLVQVGTIWGLTSLSGIVTGLVGGSLGDRFGARRTLIVACILTGIGGALRGLATDFFSLGATVLLFGLVGPAIPMNVHKTCGIWFSKRQLGLANGVVSAGMALGFVLGARLSGTVLSPWLGGWRNVLFLYGALGVSLSLFWALTREPSAEMTATDDHGPSSIRGTFARVVRLKSVWLFGLAIMGINGGIQGTLGYLSLYLQGIGWAAERADSALATFHLTSLIATIPIALLSDRLGVRKPILIAAALMFATGMGLLSVVQGGLVLVAVIIAGFFRDGFMAIFMTSIIEIKGVGAIYAGTATGMVMIFSQIGGVLSPPIGNWLADLVPSLPFAFWASLVVLGLVSLSFVRSAQQEGQAEQLQQTNII